MHVIFHTRLDSLSDWNVVRIDTGRVPNHATTLTSEVSVSLTPPTDTITVAASSVMRPNLNSGTMIKFINH
jgi:hypothetical protein